MVLIDAGSSIAEKVHVKRLSQSMRDHYSEAGILTVSFSGYIGMDGVFVLHM